MQTDESKVMEKFFGKLVTQAELNIEGIEKPIPFDIYDGHAVCFDLDGHRYDMIYPMISVVRTTKALQDEIIDYCDDVDNMDEISPLHSLQTFNTMYIDGVVYRGEKEAA